MSWNILRKIAGGALILLGLLALLTPLTPGGWLVFVGAELLGIKMFSPEKLKEWVRYFKGVKDLPQEPTKE